MDNNASTTTTTTAGDSGGSCGSSSQIKRPYSRRARVLLVGSGRMGQIRAKAIYSNPRFELIGIVDSNVDAAMKLAEMYRVSSKWRERESMCVCVFMFLFRFQIQ